MSDGPFMEIAAECERLIASGATIFQKFTCEGCRARQTMPDPNVLFTLGRCDECHFITDMRVTGCGFMMVASGDPEQHAEFVKTLAESIATSQPRNRN